MFILWFAHGCKEKSKHEFMLIIWFVWLMYGLIWHSYLIYSCSISSATMLSPNVYIFCLTFPLSPDPTQLEEHEKFFVFFMKHGSHFCEDIINFINLIKVDSLRHDTMTSKKVWNKASVVLDSNALFFDNMMQHGAKQNVLLSLLFPLSIT